MNGIFKLSIELGNEAMMNPGAVARTLENVAGILRRTLSPLPGRVEDGAIVDGNGNRVGSWTLAADGPLVMSAADRKGAKS